MSSQLGSSHEFMSFLDRDDLMLSEADQTMLTAVTTTDKVDASMTMADVTMLTAVDQIDADLDDLPFPSQIPATDIEEEDCVSEGIEATAAALDDDEECDEFFEFELDMTLTQVNTAVPPTDPVIEAFDKDTTILPVVEFNESVVNVPPLVGFTTATGKRLPPPSEEALERAAQLDAVEFTGFTTGKGRSLPPPSEESIKRAKRIIAAAADDDDVLDEPKTIPALVGFSTGKGKALPPPSKAAMEKAQRLIEGESTDASTMPSFVGFSTGRGNALPPPSKEALEKARNLISSETRPESFPVVGFSTGKGKALAPPSKEAIEKAQRLVSSEGSSSFNVGFSTGKGASLPPPSKAAMQRARSLVDNENCTPKQPTVSSTTTTTTSLPKRRIWNQPRQIAPVKQQSQPKKAQLVSLFDMTCAQPRRKLAEYFAPSLPAKYSPAIYSQYGASREILQMNSVTSAAFRWPNFGPDEARAALIDAGAQPSCCSLEWVQNHWRWIVWKFAAQIRAFPQGYSADNLSPPFVLSQLAYRYEREVNRCQRSALKRCLERDDSASKYMCLAVAQIDRIRGCVELTDGWYSCWTAAFDGPMRELLHKDRIFLGQKLEICGAQLTGEDGIPAVEGSRPDCPVKLVICRNSVRRATWDTKLGFQFTAPAFLKQLRHVHPQGGYLPAVKVCILRCYPLAFRDDSTGHVRSEREHFEFIERSLSDRSSRSSSSFHPDELDKPDDASLSFSPIQKIRACDPERPQEVQCIITFWCPIEALPAEGTVATFTALKTPLKAKRLSWPVEDFSPILLSATKSTRIIPEATKAAASDRIPPLSIETSSLVEIDKKGDYDVLGRFLGKSGNSLLWFCPPDFDATSGEAECPELPLFCLKLPSLLSHLSFAVGERVLWRDIHFLHYDSRATVYMFDYTERTDFRRSKDRARPPSPLLLDRFLEKYKTLIK